MAKPTLEEQFEKVVRTGFREVVDGPDGRPAAAIVPLGDLRRLQRADDEARNRLNFNRSDDGRLVPFLDDEEPEGGVKRVHEHPRPPEGRSLDVPELTEEESKGTRVDKGPARTGRPFEPK